MANFDDLLKKNRKRVEEIKKETPKAERRGPRRPWQENLEQYKDDATKKSDAPSKLTTGSPSAEVTTPPLDTQDSKRSDSRANLNATKVSEQSRNSTDTIPEQITERPSKVSEQSRNNTGTESNQGASKRSDVSSASEVSEQKYRNSADTMPEQTMDSDIKVPVQYKDNIGTDSRPQEHHSVVRSVTSDINVVNEVEKVSEQKYRNSTGTKSEQTSSHYKESVQSRNNAGTSVGTIPVQIDVYSIPKSEEKILRVLVQICVQTGKTITPKITYEKLSALSATPIESSKTLVKRLEKKGYLKRVDMRKGPGSWTVFEIPQATYQAFLTYETRMVGFESFFGHEQSTGTNTGTGRGTDIRTEPPSSSSSLYNKETTTKEPEFDLSVFNVPDILQKNGFGKGVLTQLKTYTSWTDEELQTFFDHFAYDLEYDKQNQNEILSPVKYFMRIVRNKIPYESERMLREENHALDVYKSRVSALKENLRSEKMAELGKKFEQYKASLSQQKIDELVPPTPLVKSGSDLQLIQLRSKFYNDEASET